jgi:cytochrome c biogenesis protein CcdA
MDGYLGGAALALWFGILTSISPCPLAGNVAAVSFLGQGLTRRGVALRGASYTAGRAAAYALVAALLVAGLLSSVSLSRFLREDMNRFLGPVLVVTGMFLLGLLALPSAGGGGGKLVQRAASRGGVAGSFAMGFLLALSFCPVSAALFFGSLLPLSLSHRSPVAIPLVFGVGTALPVILFAAVVAFSADSVGRVYEGFRRFETAGRAVTGGIFVLVGIWYSLRYVYGVV